MTCSEQERLLVTSGNGPSECRRVVRHVLDALEAEAAARGIEIDISLRGARDLPASAIVVLSGPDAGEVARSWLGSILWRCKSPFRPRHRRKNWFIEVFRLAPSDPDVVIDPGAIEMQAIRAGGPGGQHQNKTASAIRARWVSPHGESYSVVVRDERSQHRNRQIAQARLAALVAADHADRAAARQGDMHHLHAALSRGDPARTFDGPGFRPV